MFEHKISKRAVLALGTLAFLAGCKVIPKGAPDSTPPVDQPSASTLPADQMRHRVALLVPLSGANAAAGQSIANATTMALLDTNAQNLRITTYDTAAGVPIAAARAVVSQRVPNGMTLMYHSQEKIINTPGSEITGVRGGIHNSVTRIVLKPTHMIGGYAQFSYGFNYYGTIGTNRDEFVVVRKMNKVDWLDTPAITKTGATA